MRRVHYTCIKQASSAFSSRSLHTSLVSLAAVQNRDPAKTNLIQDDRSSLSTLLKVWDRKEEEPSNLLQRNNVLQRKNQQLKAKFGSKKEKQASHKESNPQNEKSNSRKIELKQGHKHQEGRKTIEHKRKKAKPDGTRLNPNEQHIATTWFEGVNKSFLHLLYKPDFVQAFRAVSTPKGKPIEKGVTEGVEMLQQLCAMGSLHLLLSSVLHKSVSYLIPSFKTDFYNQKNSYFRILCDYLQIEPPTIQLSTSNENLSKILSEIQADLVEQRALILREVGKHYPSPLSNLKNRDKTLAGELIDSKTTEKKTLDLESLKYSHIETDTDQVASLAHGLDRVLFSPGVHVLKDFRTQVYNFDASLSHIPSVDEFAFDKIPQYITASKDKLLESIAREHKKQFVCSTSSTVGLLCQISLWLRGEQPLRFKNAGTWAQTKIKTEFSAGLRLPASVIVQWKDGHYVYDADKSFELSTENILSQYGHLLEKMVTTDAKEFSRFLKSSPDPAPSEANNVQAYAYMITDALLVRSQLDAHHKLLPNVSFDVKTRGSAAVRFDRLNHENASSYEITRQFGEWGSFEREYIDLIRSAFLKYQFQARLGNMDGCIVCYHSTSQFFGFQYVPLCEMDEALFNLSEQPLELGSRENGDKNFKTCVGFLQQILQTAVSHFPEQTFRLTFDHSALPSAIHSAIVNRPAYNEARSLRVFIEPVTVENQVATPRGETMKMLEISIPLETPQPYDLVRSNLEYSVTTYSTDSESSIEKSFIPRALAHSRDLQRVFNTLYLPEGIAEEAVKAAHEYVSAVEEGLEVSSEDAEKLAQLAKQFPAKDGLAYKSQVTKVIQQLRSKAKLHATAREAEDAELPRTSYTGRWSLSD